MHQNKNSKTTHHQSFPWLSILLGEKTTPSKTHTVLIWVYQKLIPTFTLTVKGMFKFSATLLGAHIKMWAFAYTGHSLQIWTD